MYQDFTKVFRFIFKKKQRKWWDVAATPTLKHVFLLIILSIHCTFLKHFFAKPLNNMLNFLVFELFLMFVFPISLSGYLSFSLHSFFPKFPISRIDTRIKILYLSYRFVTETHNIGATQKVTRNQKHMYMLNKRLLYEPNCVSVLFLLCLFLFLFLFNKK